MGSGRSGSDGNASAKLSSSRMLKKASSGILVAEKSSTYPRGYACGFSLPAALLARLFEHPTMVRIPT